MLPVLPASRRFFVWLLEDDGVKDGQSSSRFDGVSFDKKKKSKCFKFYTDTLINNEFLFKKKKNQNVLSFTQTH